MISIACVVEGHGEVMAVPIMLRRVAAALGVTVQIRKPHRVPRSKSPDEWARAVELQRRALEGLNGVVLVILDADDDDPNALRERLMQAIEARLGDRNVIICVPVREFEAWYLASVESLRGRLGVTGDAAFDGDPELVRDAKGALEDVMTMSYSPVIHQPKFAAVFDMERAAQRSTSFRACRDGLSAFLLGAAG